MKILELRFKNLNSLQGHWCIDFTDAQYMATFALTGPTGAGKSTILDAICLALYGATPRLGRITKSGNEIMSRQKAECSAEVLFSSQSGQFRCFWGQKRARNKIDGALQEPRHEIADAVTGQALEGRKSYVLKIIEEKTGMDFDRFTRSILLAQGGFDTFLKAKVEEKSKILEQITGTAIYTDISLRVHERQKEEKEKLQTLQAESSGIVLLEQNQEQEMQNTLQEKKAQEKILVTQQQEVQVALTWVNTIENLMKDEHRLRQDAERVGQQEKDFEPQKIRLEKAQKAAALDGVFAAYTALRKQHAENTQASEKEKETIPRWINAEAQHAKILQEAEHSVTTHKERLESMTPLLHEVRLLDQKIIEKNISFLAGTKAFAQEEAAMTLLQKNYTLEQEKYRAVTTRLAKVQDYLVQYAQDAWLISGFAAIKEQLENMLGKMQECAQKTQHFTHAQQEYQKQTQALQKMQQQCMAQKDHVAKATAQLKEAQKNLATLLGGTLLREYRAKKDMLLRERAYLQKIEELEAHRHKLEDGKACPLCGATEHPFALGNIPKPDSIDQEITALEALIKHAEEQEVHIQQFEKAEIAARHVYAESEKDVTITQHALAMTEKNAKIIKEEIRILHENLDSFKQAVLDSVKELGLQQLPESEKGVQSLLASLKDRQERWQKHMEQKNTEEKLLVDIGHALQRQQDGIEVKKRALQERKQTVEVVKAELIQDEKQRKQLFGDKKVDVEEGVLRKNLREAEEKEKQSRAQHQEAQQKRMAAQTRLSTLLEGMEQSLPKLHEAQQHFEEKLTLANFHHEQHFLDCRLLEEERLLLTSQAQNLERSKTECEARQKDCATRLQQERAKNLSSNSLEVLQEHHKAGEEALQENRENMAKLTYALQENKAAKARIHEKQAAIHAQRIEYQRWEKLHSLIGSADGKKYRNFAQGLTFELMVSHANRQLAKMTDRYLLVRDKDHPLELNVIDGYQAGEVRSIKNLSGGESFIVSLTLALGLSKMSSRKVRVDSLFLDEGFGSLDEDALEMALETLSGLQEDGKLIGVISHIAALKERIGTQIQVIPLSGGRSILSGPGCSLVEEKA